MVYICIMRDQRKFSDILLNKRIEQTYKQHRTLFFSYIGTADHGLKEILNNRKIDRIRTMKPIKLMVKSRQSVQVFLRISKPTAYLHGALWSQSFVNDQFNTLKQLINEDQLIAITIIETLYQNMQQMRMI